MSVLTRAARRYEATSRWGTPGRSQAGIGAADHVKGHCWQKKLVTPAAKREAVAQARTIRRDALRSLVSEEAFDKVRRPRDRPRGLRVVFFRAPDTVLVNVQNDGGEYYAAGRNCPPTP